MTEPLKKCILTINTMSQMPLFTSVRWTVTDLTRYIRRMLEADELLQDIWVQGEISNLSRPSSGHLYFTLKDVGAALRCVMWHTETVRLDMVLQDGLSVELHGHIGVYEVAGQYQLYADIIQPLGEGALYQEFLRLKAVLESEGLFDAARKRPVPSWPHRIGIVTSPTGAALRDMLNTLRRRFPLAEVILAPSPVQGEDAPPGIVAALAGLNQYVHPDVILLGRGGGSLEDLWAFNDERLVRAVIASAAPVITGVGHETDFTLVDFAADLRAPTPTAAAELATPLTLVDLAAALADRSSRLREAALALFSRRRLQVEDFRNQLRYLSPLRRLQTDRQRLDDLQHRGLIALAHRTQLDAARLKSLEHRLGALNPLAVLGRGYAVVTRREDGSLVYRRQQARPGDDLHVRVSDGEFGAKVTSD